MSSNYSDYHRAALAEHDRVSLVYSGDNELDVIAGAEKILREAAESRLLKIGKQIGNFLLKGAAYSSAYMPCMAVKSLAELQQGEES